MKTNELYSMRELFNAVNSMQKQGRSEIKYGTVRAVLESIYEEAKELRRKQIKGLEEKK